MKEGNVG